MIRSESNPAPMWRVTRPGKYGPGTPGQTNPRARQGHYVRAASENLARKAIRERLDLAVHEILDVESWEGK